MVWSTSADVYDSFGVSSILYVAILHRGRSRVKVAASHTTGVLPFSSNGGGAVHARAFWEYVAYPEGIQIITCGSVPTSRHLVEEVQALTRWALFGT